VNAAEAFMDAQIDEIGDGIFRFSLYVPEIAPPAGFTFNHFLIKGDEPLLFHCGKRKMFASLAPAVAKVLPLDELRWIAFGHFEADECGAMNEWLAVAPPAELAHGMLACRLSVADMADRPPRMLTDGEVVDIGGRRVRYIDTPHVPHGWDAGVIFEETTRTLFAGDLFAHYGRGPALTRSEIVGPATASDDINMATALGPTTAPTIRRLASLEPAMLAVMHGSSFEGDGGAQLRALADFYDGRLRAAMSVG
jgi:flavorubredoxin